MIVEPTYISQAVGAARQHYAGTLLLDVAAAERIIAKATFDKLRELYRDLHRRSAFIDDVRPWDQFAQWWRGYSAEAAYGMHYGLHLDGMLEDRPGRPDYTHRNRWVDVKATRTGSSAFIKIREDVLERDLTKWRFAGAHVTDGSHLVTLMGTIEGTRLLDYTPQAPEPGHDKRYIRVPFSDLDPITPREAT